VKSVDLYLNHIRDAFDRIPDHTQHGRESLFEDQIIQDAVIRNITVIGEAVKHIPQDFRAAHDYIPWANMAGMRDVVVHRYMEIDLEAVWDVVNRHIPAIYPRIDELIRRSRSKD
jgi:uncharacterized protein with HEPN domain